MPVLYTPAGILCFVTMILCFLTAIILLSFSKLKTPATLLLASSYFTLGFGFILVFLVYTRLIQYVPHLYRTGNIFFLLYLPLSYLYVKTSATGKPPVAADLLHLLPALFYIVDFFPFFLLPAAQKITAIQADLTNLDNVTSYRQSWLLPGSFHVPVRTILWTLYWIFQVTLLIKLERSVLKKNKAWFRWQLTYHGLQVFFFVPALISLFTHQSFVWTTTIPPAVAAILSIITLFMTPAVLYNVQPVWKRSNIRVQKKLTVPNPSVEFIHRLETMIRDKKPFLKSNYSLKELADELQMPAHRVSSLLNSSTGKNFNDYINLKRIRYCIDLVKTGGADNLNLHGLASKCGFSNRNTFTTAFKKITGLNPSDYFRFDKTQEDENRW